MDKILFLKEADRMAASETNAGTREYVYKKAAPVTGTKPKRVLCSVCDVPPHPSAGLAL